MDKKTRAFLSDQQIPKGLLRRVFKKDTSGFELREKTLAFSRDNRLNKDQQNAIKKMVEYNDAQGFYKDDKIVVDEEAAKELEKYHEERIAKGIRDGQIEKFDPKKDKQARRLMELSKKDD